MQKQEKKRNLTLSKETIRQLIPSELHEVAAGGLNCGGESVGDCSGGGEMASAWCSLIRY